MKDSPEPPIVSVNLELPRAGFHVFVIGKTYRCLGFIDGQGVWREAVRKQELRDVTGWMTLAR